MAKKSAQPPADPPVSAASGPPEVPERRVLLHRLMMLETQVKAMQRQTEVQLAAFAGSIQKLRALLEGSLAPEDLEAPEPAPAAAPATPAPAAAPATPAPAAAPAETPAREVRVVTVGSGVTTRREPAAPALPNLLRQPPEESKRAAPEAPSDDSRDLEAKMMRKVKQITAWENDGTVDQRTRALTLSPEEMAELASASEKARQGRRRVQEQAPSDAATTRPEQRKRVSTHDHANVPYPDDVQRSKRLMFEFKAAIQQLMENPLIPGTNELIAVDMRDELTWYSRLILEDFLSMHDKAKTKAAERYESIRAINPDLDDPQLFWDPEAIADYRAYRTTTFIEKFLDHLEGEIRELRERQYVDLLDYLADVVGLERLEIELGTTTYDPALHRVDPPQIPHLRDEEPDGKPIVEIVKSGYRDTADEELVRPATVRLHLPQPERQADDETAPHEDLDDLIFQWPDAEADADAADEDDTQPLRRSGVADLDLDQEDDDDFDFVIQSPHMDADEEDLREPVESVSLDLQLPEAGQEPEEEPEAALPSAAATDISDLPTPMEVIRCQTHMSSLKVAIAAITRDSCLPLSGDELDAEIADLLSQHSSHYLRQFMNLHQAGVAEARAKRHELDRGPVDVRDPDAYWPPDLVQQYVDFRTVTFVTELLDKLEIRIVSKRLHNHQELLDHLAMEMELGRVGITPNITRFNAERHELITQKVPDNADLSACTILTVVKSGYTDMGTGAVARKAQVTVKLPQFRADP